MNLDLDLLKKISAKYMNQPILFFGFTFMIWKHFLAQIESSGISFSFSNGSVIHGGGWKKLIDQAVSEDDFKKSFKKLLNIRNVYTYKPFVKQRAYKKVIYLKLAKRNNGSLFGLIGTSTLFLVAQEITW